MKWICVAISVERNQHVSQWTLKCRHYRWFCALYFNDDEMWLIWRQLRYTTYDVCVNACEIFQSMEIYISVYSIHELTDKEYHFTMSGKMSPKCERKTFNDVRVCAFFCPFRSFHRLLSMLFVWWCFNNWRPFHNLKLMIMMTMMKMTATTTTHYY